METLFLPTQAVGGCVLLSTITLLARPFLVLNYRALLFMATGGWFEIAKDLFAHRSLSSCASTANLPTPCCFFLAMVEQYSVCGLATGSWEKHNYSYTHTLRMGDCVLCLWLARGYLGTTFALRGFWSEWYLLP